MKALAIAMTDLRRLFRERSNIFFVFLFPLLLIFLLGATFGGELTPKLGISGRGGPLGGSLVRALERRPDVEVVRFESPSELITAVERGQVAGGLIIPENYDRLVRESQAAPAYFARPDTGGRELSLAVQASVADQGMLIRAARLAEREGAGSFEEGLATARQVVDRVPRVRVRTETAGEAAFPASLGRFDVGASSQLVLFVFITSLTGAVALIEARRLGVLRRMLATPTSGRSILLGAAAGRFAVALVQGTFIIVGTALLFGVSWGDPLGAGALLIAFCLVGAGAGMLVGAVFRTEQQAGSIGVLLGLGLAALGGAMVPPDLFSDTIRQIGHATPHAWAIDGFAKVIREGGTIMDVAPEVGVLLGYAAVLLAVASWRLRKVLTT